ncbi:MAG: transcriptional regulator, MarR family [Variovorax sp.]|nr:transcriptional regulator, MarR family [Variovorax sp.]
MDEVDTARPPAATQPPPGTARLGEVPAFYHPDNYRAEESIGYLMKRILSAVGQSVELHVCDPGPTFPQWLPLYKVHQGQATTVAELARECELDTGAMTRLLDRLELKGLCRRVRSLEDRRVVHIELTEQGRAAAEEVPHVLSRVQNEHLAGFTEPEWEQLKGYLHRILENAKVIAACRGSHD